MDRRTYLAVGTGLLAGLAGCGSDTDGSTDETQSSDAVTQTASQEETAASTSTSSQEETEPATDTATEEEPDTPEDTPEDTDTPEEDTAAESDDTSADYQVRVDYDGEWMGSITGGSSSRSVDGSGRETFDVNGDPYIVSANAQKDDDSSATLTVEILKNGAVVAEQSTSAEYGVAQVTSDGEGQSDSSGDDSGSSRAFEVRIQYSGEWSGTVGSASSTRTISGSGEKTVAIDGSPDIVSANAQKQDDSSDTLTIQILKDGEVVKEASTEAEYGMAQISYSAF